jgi:hypothetical protein
MNTSTLTLNADASTLRTAKSIKPITADQVGRTLVCKWDMLAVIGLMVSCGTYGVYAIAQMTGF